jgi:hypothetical protein
MPTKRNPYNALPLLELMEEIQHVTQAIDACAERHRLAYLVEQRELMIRAARKRQARRRDKATAAQMVAALMEVDRKRRAEDKK